MHFGEWEGLSVHSLNAEAPLALAQFWADPAANPPPGGERLEAFCARIDTALARLCYEHLGNTLLVVTHGGPIRYLLACARSLPSNALTSIEVPYGSLHRLRVEWTKADIPRLTEISRGAT
jgi:broad specificity phosphatase PhoE